MPTTNSKDLIYWPMKVTNEEERFKTNLEEITQQIKRRR